VTYQDDSHLWANKLHARLFGEERANVGFDDQWIDMSENRNVQGDGRTDGGASGLGPNIQNWALGATVTFPAFDWFSNHAKKEAEAHARVARCPWRIQLHQSARPGFADDRQRPRGKLNKMPSLRLLLLLHGCTYAGRFAVSSGAVSGGEAEAGALKQFTTREQR
jgi:hypothetical protein